MKHLSDDVLLRYTLELFDNNDRIDVENHLSECPECMRRMETIQRENTELAELEFQLEDAEYVFPFRKRFSMKPIFRIAALLIIGFAVGFGTAIYVNPPEVRVVPQNLTVNPPEVSFAEYTACEAVDLGSF